MEIKVELLKHPTQEDWFEVKRRAFITINRTELKPPSVKWCKDILRARHSPIRYLQFSFYLEIPTYVSTHLVRHIHTVPYVQSQRNDRQAEYDRSKATQGAPVKMIWDMNAEALLTVANKRLCMKADPTTRAVICKLCDQVIARCPEFKEFLVPMCEYNGNVCHEMRGCNRWN